MRGLDVLPGQGRRELRHSQHLSWYESAPSCTWGVAPLSTEMEDVLLRWETQTTQSSQTPDLQSLLLPTPVLNWEEPVQKLCVSYTSNLQKNNH